MPENRPEEKVTLRPSVTGDIQDARLLYLKGITFVLLGGLATLLLVLQTRHWYVALLHGIAIWSFARAYYFAFYVVQHYVDPTFRFSGLFAFARYVMTAKTGRNL